MTKRAILFLFVIQLAVSAWAYSTVQSDDAHHTEIKEGWNLISVPCNISAEDFQENLGRDDIRIFEWNDFEYLEVDTLYKGQGYLQFSPVALDINSICGSGGDEEPLMLVLNNGWNLLGNPYHKSVDFSEVIDESVFATLAIYEYQGNQYREVSWDDGMKPWSGYWVFVSAFNICGSNSDCDDGAPTTTDICLNPETPQAKCSNEACAIACRSDADCDDGDNNTIGDCLNPNTCSAECRQATMPGDCDYKWIYFTPVQCGLNPWEVNQVDESYFGDYDEKEQIRKYYLEEYGVKILNSYSYGYFQIVCLACTCPRGDVMLFRSVKGNCIVCQQCGCISA